MSNLHTSLSFMDTMLAHGYGFILDDFGTGLSSFAQLKNLKVAMLKLDGTFIRNLISDPIDYNMVKSIHELARAIGIRTVAEFVETAAIQDQVRAIGVDFSQGYALHRPEPLKNL